jgi:magnesium-transporting ATPase (P-type)
MPKGMDVIDVLSASLFVTAAASNVVLGVLFFLNVIGVIYLLVGWACWWVARGIWRHWRQNRDVWWVGVVLAILNLVSLGYPVPNLTPWMLFVLHVLTDIQVANAAIGLTALAYFVARRRQFGIGVHGTTGYKDPRSRGA